MEGMKKYGNNCRRRNNDEKLCKEWNDTKEDVLDYGRNIATNGEKKDGSQPVTVINIR